MDKKERQKIEQQRREMALTNTFLIDIFFYVIQ
ncbi:PTS transporter [Streptococcus pneumoniae]|nr:PTS transporter [Streptococcus pneumoniae]VRL10024.1 PTS transporter [Streptococcus pneumoniae]